jgi:ring-1,2-phenylacetyl-CoA epoxidase subunit PaaA
MFDIYYEYGIKVKKSEELQAEYMELLDSRLKEIGLVVPEGVEADYDMRMGYEAEELAA